MKIHHNTIPKKIENLVLTIGTFDGVHRGHVELLKTIRNKAKEIGGESGLLTFHPHPRLILQPAENKIYLLNTIEERIERLREVGIDHLFIVPFSVDFANMLAEDYVTEFLVKQFQFTQLVIGYDHRFGKNRAGDIDLLIDLSKKYDFSVEQIKKQEIKDITFSSTIIRESLLAGKIDRANELLGYNYSLTGIVVHGDQRGRELGFPTANVKILNEKKLIPEKGVYIVKSTVNKKQFDGLLNVGVRPTFDGEHKTIENHLFHFSESIYGCQVTIEFLKKLRNEKKFENQSELTAQIEEDKKAAIRFFKTNE